MITPKTPSPLNYLLLRIANLTFMRLRFINEAVKKAFVKLLINKQSPLPLRVNRMIEFQKGTIHITDTIEKRGSIKIKSLVYENKFSTIHMASSRYFIPSQLRKMVKPTIDIGALNSKGLITHSFTINVNKLSGNNKE